MNAMNKIEATMHLHDDESQPKQHAHIRNIDVLLHRTEYLDRGMTKLGWRCRSTSHAHTHTHPLKPRVVRVLLT